MHDEEGIVTADQIVQHYNEFQRKRKIDKAKAVQWPMQSLILRDVAKAVRVTQQAECDKALAILTKRQA